MTSRRCVFTQNAEHRTISMYNRFEFCAYPDFSYVLLSSIAKPFISLLIYWGRKGNKKFDNKKSGIQKITVIIIVIKRAGLNKFYVLIKDKIIILNLPATKVSVTHIIDFDIIKWIIITFVQPVYIIIIINLNFLSLSRRHVEIRHLRQRFKARYIFIAFYTRERNYNY